MRAVLDSNVWISGVAFSGATRDILRELKPGRAVTLVSATLLDEVRDVLVAKFKYSAAAAAGIAEMIKGRSEWVAPEKRLRVVSRDPDDDRIVECAVEGAADLIVSGDSHLLVLKRVQGIEIVTPRRFRTILGEKS